MFRHIRAATAVLATASALSFACGASPASVPSRSPIGTTSVSVPRSAPLVPASTSTAPSDPVPSVLQTTTLFWAKGAAWTQDGGLLIAGSGELATVTLRPSLQIDRSKRSFLKLFASPSVRGVALHDGTAPISLLHGHPPKPFATIGQGVPSSDPQGIFSPDGTLFVVAGCVDPSEARLRCRGGIFDAKTGAALGSFSLGHTVETMQFSPDRKFVVITAMSTGLTIVEASTGRVALTLPRWRVSQSDLHAFLGADLVEFVDGDVVVSDDREVARVDLATGKPRSRIANSYSHVSYGARSQRLALLDGPSNVVTVRDFDPKGTARRVTFGKFMDGGTCKYCFLRFQEDPEGTLWIEPNYNESLAIAVDTNAGTAIAHDARVSHPDIPVRVLALPEGHLDRRRGNHCELTLREGQPPQELAKEFCELSVSTAQPGLDPQGRLFAVVSTRGNVLVADTRDGNVRYVFARAEK